MANETTSQSSVASDPSVPASTSPTDSGATVEAPVGGSGIQITQGPPPVNPKSFEALRASRAERLAKLGENSGGTPAVPPQGTDAASVRGTNSAPVATPPAAKTDENKTTVKVDVPQDRLDAFVHLNTELRAKEQEIAGLKAKAEAFDRFEHYQSLVKAGKHVEAAKFIGLDLDAANLEILGAKPDNAVDPRIEALEAEIAALKSTEQSRASVEVAEAREAGKSATLEHVKTNAAEFPLLSKSERWVSAALSRAQRDYDAFVQKAGRPGTIAEKDGIVLKALKDEEAERAEDAKLYGSKPNDQTDSSSGNTSLGSTGNTITKDMRGPLSTPGSKPPQKMTFEEVRRRRREAMRS